MVETVLLTTLIGAGFVARGLLSIFELFGIVGGSTYEWIGNA